MDIEIRIGPFHQWPMAMKKLIEISPEICAADVGYGFYPLPVTASVTIHSNIVML
jgi:hypothetical protein